MNTMLRSSTAPGKTALAPSSLTTTGRPMATGGGVHRGVWIGGGLMALTIVALATALVVKSNGSAPTAVAPLATATTVPAAPVVTPDPAAATVAPPVVVAQTPPAAEPVRPAPVRAVHHTPARTTTHSNSSGNTTVASNDGGSVVSPVNTESARPAPPPPPQICTSCGTVDSFDAVQVAGTPNGVGAVGGGAVGAVVGSQIAGRHNHTLGGVIGAIGGGQLGNEIEKRQRTNTVYDVHVRMEDGSMRTVRQTNAPAVGDKVTVDGNSIHGRSSSSSSGYNNSSTSQVGYAPAQPSGNGGSSFTPSGN